MVLKKPKTNKNNKKKMMLNTTGIFSVMLTVYLTALNMKVVLF